MKTLSLAVLVVTLGASGAQAQPQAAASAAPQKISQKVKKAAAADYAPQASEYGQEAKCPVTGEPFKVGAETKAVKYKGKVFYFCCPGCAPAFKKNPAKFAK